MPELFDILQQKKTQLDAEKGLPVATATMSEDEKKVVESDRKRIKVLEEYLYQAIMGENKTGVSIGLREAITSRDFPALMNRVLNDRILMPVEPTYIGQSLLATTVPVGRNVGDYSIGAFGYLEAKEVGEGQEFPEQTAEINRNATSIAIRKYGIRVAVTKEMLASDELGLWGMHVQAAKLAMNRKKEQEIFSLFWSIVNPVFDNSVAFGADLYTAASVTGLVAPTTPAKALFATSGRDINGELNATLHLFDIIDAMSVLLARNYEPTDMLINPLLWTILARDPVLNMFYMNGQATPAQMSQAPMYRSMSPDSMNNLVMPWNITLHVTPFVPVITTISATAVSAGVPYMSDIYIGSRRNGVLLLQGEPLTQDAYTSIEREIYNVRLKEYYGTGLADGGRSWTAIKNIRIDRSYEPVVTRTLLTADA